MVIKGWVKRHSEWELLLLQWNTALYRALLQSSDNYKIGEMICRNVVNTAVILAITAFAGDFVHGFTQRRERITLNDL